MFHCIYAGNYIRRKNHKYSKIITQKKLQWNREERQNHKTFGSIKAENKTKMPDTFQRNPSNLTRKKQDFVLTVSVLITLCRVRVFYLSPCFIPSPYSVVRSPRFIPKSMFYTRSVVRSPCFILTGLLFFFSFLEADSKVDSLSMNFTLISRKRELTLVMQRVETIRKCDLREIVTQSSSFLCFYVAIIISSEF